MTNTIFILLLISYSLSVSAFESGVYRGEGNGTKCQVLLEQGEKEVVLEYKCITASGTELETSIAQTYNFGSYSNEVEDSSGRYQVSGIANANLLEYKVVKISQNNATWLERISNVAPGKIHYLMTFDGDDWLNLNLTLEKNN